MRVDQRLRVRHQRPDPLLQLCQPEIYAALKTVVFASDLGLARCVSGRVQSAVILAGRTGFFANTALSLPTITDLTALNAIVLFGCGMILLQTRREGADLL